MQTAIGAKGFYGGCWASTAATTGGTAYVNFLTRVTAALGLALSGGVAADNRLVAVCWQEGEEDAQGNVSSTTYKTALRKFYTNYNAGVKSYLQSNKGFSSAQATAAVAPAFFLVGGMTRAAVNGTLVPATGYAAVTAAAKDVAGTVYGAAPPRSAYVTSELPGITDRNDIHFSSSEYDVLACSYVNVYKSLAGTVARPIPYVQSNVTSSAAMESISGTAVSFYRSSSIVFDSARNKYVFNLPMGAQVLFNVQFRSGPFTKSVWVKWVAKATYPNIFGGSANGTLSRFVHNMWEFNDGYVRSGITASGNWADSAISTVPLVIPGANWVHYACTFDDYRTMKMYVNGVQSGATKTISIDNPGCSDPGNAVILGAWNILTSGEFAGLIDDARIYDMALTDTQIGQIYAGTL